MKASHAGEETLDPENWDDVRRLGHRMLDDMLDYLRTVRDRNVWSSPPEGVRTRLKEPLPRNGQGLEHAYKDFQECVLPYPSGNIHPRFWGWVIGTGSPSAMLAEMLASAMNPNCRGCADAASRVEDQVLAWCREMLGMPASGSGLLVSGGSMANLVGLAAARNSRAGFDVRALGVGSASRPLVLYASTETHNSNVKAVELLGLGRHALRLIPVDEQFRIDIPKLRIAIDADLKAGCHPLALVANAGTVNTGAIDDLESLASLCREKGLWLHVDGAFGAMAAMAPALRPLVRGMEHADSLAFDLHKWGYLPIEIGCVLIRDREEHHQAFALAADYLAPSRGGPSARTHRYAEYGPQLSREFRALKAWMGLKEHGTDKFGRLIEQNVRQAQYLASRIQKEPALELLAPVPLNVVCFRYRVTHSMRADAADAFNAEILQRLQVSGRALPSHTKVRGAFALRVAIVNHRTRRSDLDLLVEDVLSLGRALEREAVPV